MNIYLTGDTHGRFERIACFCKDNDTTPDDCSSYSATPVSTITAATGTRNLSSTLRRCR